MVIDITVKPNELKKETRMLIESKEYFPYAGAYIGKYSYCWNTHIDNGIEFEAKNGTLNYNFSVGNFNSIANNLSVTIGKNHNIKSVDTGALALMLDEYKLIPEYYDKNFNQKGSVIIQNDVWIGENVTIMSGVIVRNGAVIAKNSHVVSDVPPYAVVGGNPAKIIGYRYSKEIIEKMQQIQWWYWDDNKIIENAQYFNEDVECFCDRFYDEANQRIMSCAKGKKDKGDRYFCFVDYYEIYSSYAVILEQFLDLYMNDSSKELILFIQENLEIRIEEELMKKIQNIVDEINRENDILCSVVLRRGSNKDAENTFLNSSHYIMTRTYQSVYFSCIADMFGIEIISGVDSKIQFTKGHNIYRK